MLLAEKDKTIDFYVPFYEYLSIFVKAIKICHKKTISVTNGAPQLLFAKSFASRKL